MSHHVLVIIFTPIQRHRATSIASDSIPTEERQETISINAEYGGKLEKGTYRLVAPCSLSATPPDNSELSDSSEQTVDIATEFGLF